MQWNPSNVINLQNVNNAITSKSKWWHQNNTKCSFEKSLETTCMLQNNFN